jgi:hypothetical protein
VLWSWWMAFINQPRGGMRGDAARQKAFTAIRTTTRNFAASCSNHLRRTVMAALAPRSSITSEQRLYRDEAQPARLATIVIDNNDLAEPIIIR